MTYIQSTQAFAQAQKYIPGGVNSPVRSFKSVGGTPVFIESARGAYIVDIDGNSYIDYVGSWGPMILGHAHNDVVASLSDAIARGTSYGAPTLLETALAKLIGEMMPSIESVRMVNSGTEATMSAIRLARGYTNRSKIVKFEGCYHGHGDSFLIQAGSGALTLSNPNSPGVTKGTAQDTLLAQFNNSESLETIFQQFGHDIAAVIIEPVTGNMGVVLPKKEFLMNLQTLCKKYGALLIFDEVMTGFRLAKGGAQSIYGISPDITCLGKIIGGGLPVGAYGGKKEIMNSLAPQGAIYQAGTLSGNPLAMSAGYTTLNILNSNSDFYTQLETRAAQLEQGIQKNIKDLGIPAVFNRIGSMFTLFFTTEKQVESYVDVCTSNTEQYAKFFKASLDAGIYFAPSQFEAGFVSAAHTEQDIEITITKNREALSQLL